MSGTDLDKTGDGKVTGDEASIKVWNQIVNLLDEKLQYALLEQMKAVKVVKLGAGELNLVVTTTEAYDFFSAHINQQRLIILSRPVAAIEKVSVVPIP